MKTALSIAAFLAMCVFAPAAYAGSILQFSLNSYGSLPEFYQPAVGAPLQANGIPIEAITITSPSFPYPDGFCIECPFPWITGPFAGNSSTDWFFWGGGSLSMTVPNFSGQILPPGSTLFHGSFTGRSDLTSTSLGPELGYYIFNAPDVSVEVNPALSSLLSIPNGRYDGSFFEQTTPGGGCGGNNPPPGAAFSGCVQYMSLDLNPAPPSETPEPTSFLLFGSAILGLLAAIKLKSVIA
jgi:hypothetical protein